MSAVLSNSAESQTFRDQGLVISPQKCERLCSHLDNTPTLRVWRVNQFFHLMNMYTLDEREQNSTRTNPGSLLNYNPLFDLICRNRSCQTQFR